MENIDNLLPLEKYLHYKSHNGGRFPSRNSNYFEKYLMLKKILTPIYNSADLNACFIDKNYYTHHGLGHVDDVIVYVGRLLGIDENWQPNENKQIFSDSYSVFILLVSILLHDVGMYYGREGHEQKCLAVLMENKNIFNDAVENKSISNIAKAHSGRFNESKDTLSNPELRVDQTYLGCTYDSKELAALVRFADEICETKERAKSFALSSGLVTEKSLICHKYCSYINSVQVSPGRDSISIEYIIPIEDVKKAVPLDGSKRFMIDEIAERLDKINKERVYCNRYFSRCLYIRKIIARIEVVDADYKTRFSERLSLEDSGYPDQIVSIKDLYPSFSGLKYRSKKK